MNEIQFIDVDSQKIYNLLIKAFEQALGETIYPGDERRIFLLQMLPLIVGLKNDINESAKQNLLRYASGDKLDAIGEFYNTTRLPARKAKVTLRFTLSTAQANNITIPIGTRVTPDGQLYFATVKTFTVAAGQTYGEILAEAAEGGEVYNGFTPGQIKTIVDPIPYISSVSNIDTSLGGADIENDNSFRERIRLAPGSFSVAGPEEAYIYWAKSADINISDVTAKQVSPGTVQITVLMKQGEIPTQLVLDAVVEAVNSKTRRPLTDNVQVMAPSESIYNIDLTYYISEERKTDESVIRKAIEGANGAIEQYRIWQSAKLGRNINPDYLRQLMLNVGAYRIDIVSPIYTEVESHQVAKIGVITTNYGGLI